MLLLNTLPAHGAALDAADARLLGAEGAAEAMAGIGRLDGAGPTPLVSLPGLAAELSVAAIHLKDEGRRLGLGSFKALGGAYAVMRLAGEARAGGASSPMVFACATDGNHGRSVAFGARRVGARAVIFVHGGVSDARAAAIAAYGAEIVRVAGTYDDSVAEAARVSAENGWTVVSDTAWPGYERIPGLVMQGYTTIAAETLAALPAPPTHVFLQAGVGGLAAAVAGHLAATLDAARPKVVVVEPDKAACLFASARAGTLTAIPAGEATVMAMLECYAPSLSAWRILERTADAFLTVSDTDAVAAMLRLGAPAAGDAAIVAGESGGAGLAGLMVAAGDPDMRRSLGLDATSRVWLINSEGATDPDLYRRLTGLDPERVAA